MDLAKSDAQTKKITSGRNEFISPADKKWEPPGRIYIGKDAIR